MKAKMLMTTILVLGLTGIVLAGEVESLQRSFETPPKSAAPFTWWHWVDGNVTKEGITKDLEALQEVGVGGVLLFDVGMNLPAGKVLFGSDEWWDALNHAMKESARLGLDFGAFNCAGFSQSGGPWITPEMSMKKLVFSQVEVPKAGKVKLPQPKSKLKFYRDVVIVAYPKPAKQAMLNAWNLKSGQRHIVQHDGLYRELKKTPGTPEPPVGNTIPTDRVVLLDSSLLHGDELKWDPPAEGKWVLMRVGYTTTARQIHPAVETGKGLECDKLDAKVVRFHLKAYMAKVRERSLKIDGNPFRYLQSESWECRVQDWTARMDADFKERTGYDLRVYFPLILTGQIMGSVEESEKVLWDWRRYLADRIADYYYGEIHRFAKENGLIHMGENTGKQQYMYDSVRYHRFSDIPMGEFWRTDDLRVDNKHAASSAHITGRNRVAAEAFTSRASLNHHPAAMKALADRAFAAGVNFFVFHTYAHQPYELTPGFTMGQWGHDFHRHNTWFKPGKAWIDYLRRCQSMLQAGRPVSDILVFTGEDIPNYLGFRNEQVSPVPAGYDYDGCDWDALKTAQIEQGDIVLTSGTRYKLLVLPDSDKLRLPVAQKLKELVQSGATILASGFSDSPSWAEKGTASKMVSKIGRELFGPVQDRSVGSGRILSMSIDKALKTIGLAPDFYIPEPSAADSFVYIHRETETADIYFVANIGTGAHDVTPVFRVSGKRPECWDPYSGTISDFPVFKQTGEQTEVPMRFEPGDSVFVVFSKPADVNHLSDFKLIYSGHSGDLIKQAVYKAVNGAGQKDVTQLLNSMSRNGTLDFPVNNQTLGGDPAPRKKKVLVVEYWQDGTTRTETFQEMKRVRIGADQEVPEYLLFQKGLVPELHAFAPASFEFMTNAGKVKKIRVSEPPATVALSRPWSLEFIEGPARPASLELEKLISWTEHPDFDVKYFSGTATYRNAFELSPDACAADKAVYLSLGEVHEMAEVILNGKSLGVLWKAPFRLDISKYVKVGSNKLELRVTNIWANRLIGDARFPPEFKVGKGNKNYGVKKWPAWFPDFSQRKEKRRVTFSTAEPKRANQRLSPSGLIGPVRIQVVEKQMLATE